MIKRLLKENESFVKQWELTRKQGFGKYVITRTSSVGLMMFFIFMVGIVFGKNENYLVEAIVYAVITVLAPILSWCINEKRYKKSKML